LSSLDIGKAAGLDELNGFFLKSVAPEIFRSLTKIFNLSVSSCVFSDPWKRAKVSPLLKDGSLFDHTNFRPISVLC
ncbi:predicted protein, partial [Nematostella vectensis]